MLEKQRVETRNKRTPLDEVVPLDTPFIIFVDPCGACNFKCTFCPCNMSDYNKEERHKKMSFELFKKIVDDMQDFPSQVKVVYLYGFGEPFINKDVIKMARYLKQSKVCREIRIVTNGSFLNPQLNDEIIDSGIDLVRISVEALDSETYKTLCSANIDYDKFLANIEDLYTKSRGKLKVAAKIINASIKSEEDLEKYFSMYNPITDFCFVEDVVDGWPEFEEMPSIDDKLLEANNWIWKAKDYKRCSFSLTMMMVHSNGSICPCPNDWKASLKFGNAEQDSLVELWNSKKWHNFQLMHVDQPRQEIPFCRDCICSGYDEIDHISEVLSKNIKKHLADKENS